MIGWENLAFKSESWNWLIAEFLWNSNTLTSIIAIDIVYSHYCCCNSQHFFFVVALPLDLSFATASLRFQFTKAVVTSHFLMAHYIVIVECDLQYCCFTSIFGRLMSMYLAINLWLTAPLGLSWYPNIIAINLFDLWNHSVSLQFAESLQLLL